MKDIKWHSMRREMVYSFRTNYYTHIDLCPTCDNNIILNYAVGPYVYFIQSMFDFFTSISFYVRELPGCFMRLMGYSMLCLPFIIHDTNVYVLKGEIFCILYLHMGYVKRIGDLMSSRSSAN